MPAGDCPHRLLVGTALAALAFVLMACAPGPAATPKLPDEEPAPRTAMVNLDRAGSSEVLAVAAALLEEPVLVDAGSLAWLQCIVVTVKEPAPLPRKLAAEKLFDALRAQGVRIEILASSKRDGDTWIVKVHERPAACPAPEGEPALAALVGDAGASTGADAGSLAIPSGDAGAATFEAVQNEVLRSIREVTPGDHAITQRGLDLFLEHQALLLRQVRIVPEQENGKLLGIRLFGVRPDTVLGKLGFENGDRLERVMGKSVSSPEQALEVYAAIRSAKVIDIEIIRRGAPKQLTIRIEK